ncbi:porphobilinogen deaminase [Listeria floridensis FSL S10-1187]|uniref:Porphobilinogen deaminase n=1 Tax=Listeria floridensis FSL S10-1187 TaxID=1265817 RepID=A0ABP3B1U5_9LIST|nr:hydroxymethylbilane synthase [Listeria floridensis]EUJ33253.1 porphobilinogen deaminase [Listeria floridensis FSL S10-1187]
MTREIIVGSRRSKLALTQTRWVIARLSEHFPEYQFKIHEIVTKGDKILDVTLSKVGGKGLFVSEVEEALADETIDFAVHSMKDVPSVLHEGLVIGAIPKRESPFDCIVFDQARRLSDLKEGAVIGTSSLRRAVEILRYRPDFEIRSIRGNIDTRLRKLKEEAFDAIILAEAGLSRMGWLETGELHLEHLQPEVCLPAVGQGALAVECRADDNELTNMLARIHDPDTAFPVQAERSFLETLAGGCEIPIAGFAEKQGDELYFRGLVSSVDGKQRLTVEKQGTNPKDVGVKAAETLLEAGAAKLIAELRNG